MRSTSPVPCLESCHRRTATLSTYTCIHPSPRYPSIPAPRPPSQRTTQSSQCSEREPSRYLAAQRLPETVSSTPTLISREMSVSHGAVFPLLSPLPLPVEELVSLTLTTTATKTTVTMTTTTMTTTTMTTTTMTTTTMTTTTATARMTPTTVRSWSVSLPCSPQLPLFITFTQVARP